MAGTLKIFGMSDQLGQRSIDYKEGRVFCGRCGMSLLICGRNRYTERRQFEQSLRGMGWRYTRKNGWVCKRCAKRVVEHRRSRRNRSRRGVV